MKEAVVSIASAFVSVMAVVAWFYDASSPGSGWLLAVGCVAALALFTSLCRDAMRLLGVLYRHISRRVREFFRELRAFFALGKPVWETIAALLVFLCAGTIWWLNRNSDAAGWVMAVTIIAGLRCLIGVMLLPVPESKPTGSVNRSSCPGPRIPY